MRRHRGLTALLAAETVSMVGTAMTMLALPWLVLVTTGSAAQTGLVAAAEALPYVLASGLGGPVLDRIGVRRASLLADAASVAVVAAIPGLYAARLLPLPVLLVLVAAAGMLRGGADSAKRVLFPAVVAGSGVDLTRATSLQDGISRLATLVGVPLGGLLIAALEAPAVILIDAGTFAFAAFAVALLVRPGGARPETGQREPYLVAMRTGWRWLRQQPLVLAITLSLCVLNLFDAAYSSVLVPVWAREVAGSPVVLGVLGGCFATGAVLGNLVFTALAPKAPRWATFSVGFLIGGAPRFVALAATDQLWVVYTVSFVAGLGIAAINPILGAVLYERIPERLRARVLGINTALCWAGIPLGGLVGGALATWFGLRSALLTIGAAYLLVTLLPFVRPVWRDLDRRPKLPGQGYEADQREHRETGDSEDEPQLAAVSGWVEVAR
jgi:MFS family permease